MNPRATASMLMLTLFASLLATVSARPAAANPTDHGHETNIDFSSGSKDRTGYIAAKEIASGVKYVMAVHCGGAFSVKESGELTAETHARGGKVTGTVPSVDCGGDNSSMTIRVRKVSDGSNATTVDKTDVVTTSDDPCAKKPANSTCIYVAAVNPSAQPSPAASTQTCIAPSQGPTYETAALAPSCRIAMDDRSLRLELGGVRWVLILGFGLIIFLLGWIAVGSSRS